MANPNIVNVTTILANCVTGNFTSSNTTFHNNPASSGRVDKISSIIVSNIDGNANADFDLIINNQGSNTFFARTIVVPADATLVVVDKNSGINLLENSSIGGAASANGDLSYVINIDQVYA